MILLGAGASVPLGLPTMQELTDIAIAKVSELDKNLGDNILKKLKTAGMKPDFEAVYTILEALTDPYRAMLEAGPFAAYLLSSKEELHQRTEIKPILEELRKMIYEKCTIKRDSIKKLVGLYSRLFTSTNWNEWKNVDSPSRPVNIKVNDRIVTTNYDMALELYFRYKEIAYNDGFETINDPFVKEFRPYVIRTKFDVPWLLKIHGSIWQFWSNNKMIKTIDDPKGQTLPIDIEREMMIYPNKEKPILQDPYFTTYAAFKLEPWFRLVVIGYSFRDDPVNTAIADNMEWNPEARILIIDPKADEIKAELPERLLRYTDRINALQMKFEEDRLEQEIKDWLNQYNLSWQDFHSKLLESHAFSRRFSL